MGSARILVCASMGVFLAAGPVAAARRLIPEPPRKGITITARAVESRPRVGQVVRVRVHVAGARGVGSVPFALAYDPAVLEFLPAASVEGPFLSRGGAGTSFLAHDGRVRDGRQAVVVGLSRRGLKPAAGRGLLCELAFRVRGPGVSPLSFVNARALSVRAEPLRARFVDGSVRAAGGR
jgi:hypothetical protein